MDLTPKATKVNEVLDYTIKLIKFHLFPLSFVQQIFISIETQPEGSN